MVVTTYAGTGFAGSQDGDALTEAKFNLPVGIGGFGVGICFDNEGNLLVADAGNNKIRKISPTGMVTTIAGAGIGFLDGPANIARFNFLADIAVDSIGNIYIADGNNNRIRKLDTSGIVSTLAGSGICGSADGFGVSATFCLPTGVEIDKGGNIIVADLNGNAIRKVTPAGNVTTIKLVNNPIQVALDGTGNIFYISSLTNRVLKIDTNGIETLIAGSTPGFADGTGATAKFNEPWGIALDNDGNIYIGDQQNHRVRKIDTNNVVTTWAGTGVAGFKDGPADSAQFNTPSGLCHDATGQIFVADQNNNRIRKIAVPVPEEVTIEGTVFGDVDTSGTLTLGDTDFGGVKIRFDHTMHGTFYLFNNNDGTFKFNGPSGEYKISLVTSQNVQLTTPIIYNKTLLSGQSAININFPVFVGCRAEPTIEVNFTSPFTSACPEVPFKVCYKFRTNGGLPLLPGTTYDLLFNSFYFSFNAFAIDPSCPAQNTSIIIDQTLGKLIFVLTDIVPHNQICEICITLTPKPSTRGITIGNALQSFFNAKCDPDIPSGSAFATEDIVIDCSKDPNDKLLATPSGCGSLNKITRGELLNYKIRFQNTGTAPAFKVVIKDTIDTDMDIETLSLTDESHTLTKFEMLPGNVIIWTFENINLPDSSTDVEGSKGFVNFSINHNIAIPEGTEITNTAAIFFDLNPPVITNTTNHTIFDDPFPNADFSVSQQCAANAFDFNYTGGDTDVLFAWNFGEGAIPDSSNDENPTNVTFDSPGAKSIKLLVEDSTGCITGVKNTINIPDIVCGQNTDKILVCHTPPGNINNPQLICISPSALETHLAHGDCIGPCNTVLFSSKTQNINIEQEFEPFSNLQDHISIFPNPYTSNTFISLSYPEAQHVEIDVLNILGEKIFHVFNGILQENNSYNIELNSNQLTQGLYFVKIKSDNHFSLYKLVKLN